MIYVLRRLGVSPFTVGRSPDILPLPGVSPGSLSRTTRANRIGDTLVQPLGFELVR